MLNASEVYKWIKAWVDVDDLFEYLTPGCDDDLVNFELSFVITDQSYVTVVLFLIQLSKHCLKLFGK